MWWWSVTGLGFPNEMFRPRPGVISVSVTVAVQNVNVVTLNLHVRGDAWHVNNMCVTDTLRWGVIFHRCVPIVWWRAFKFEKFKNSVFQIRPERTNSQQNMKENIFLFFFAHKLQAHGIESVWLYKSRLHSSLTYGNLPFDSGHN